MTTLETNPGRKLDGGDGFGPAAVSPTAGWRATVGRPPARIRGHQVFAVALAAVEVPRVLAIVGYQPAVLFRKGTFDYLWRALHPSPNVINPSGYSRFLAAALALRQSGPEIVARTAPAEFLGHG